MPPDLRVTSAPSFIDYEWLVPALMGSYWGFAYTRDRILAACDHSLCFGAYLNTARQVGFARVVTDRATISLINDVIVDPEWRGQGIGTALMEAIVRHPAVEPTICILQTRDARRLYEKFGFAPVGNMLKRDPR